MASNPTPPSPAVPGEHAESVGEAAHLYTEAHPTRTDSPAYVASRKWLMEQAAGGCIVCHGPGDLSHPEAPADSHGLEDHHGGGLYLKDVLVGFNLFGLEWSLGWAADAKLVNEFIGLLKQAGFAQGWQKNVETTADVMEWVDSVYNANVKLCQPHHIGTQKQHTPDANGHEAVGIHEIPLPIWLGQVTCEWTRFDMWAGTTGTIAVAAPPTVPAGHVQVLHLHDSVQLQHGDGTPVQRYHVLPATHGVARAAHAGVKPAA